jgi:hypothetical protein
MTNDNAMDVTVAWQPSRATFAGLSRLRRPDATKVYARDEQQHIFIRKGICDL